MDIRGRIRRFLRFLNTPIQPLDPTVRIRASPRLAAAITVGGLLLEWWYFYAVPYSGIPTKTVFWLSFIGWSIWPVALQWKWRSLPSKRAVNLQANFFIAFALVGLIIVSVASKVDALLPVAEAIMPGAMAGGILAAIGSLAWQKPNN